MPFIYLVYTVQISEGLASLGIMAGAELRNPFISLQCRSQYQLLSQYLPTEFFPHFFIVGKHNVAVNINANNIIIRIKVCFLKVYCVDSIDTQRQSLEGILLPGSQILPICCLKKRGAFRAIYEQERINNSHYRP